MLDLSQEPTNPLPSEISEDFNFESMWERVAGEYTFCKLLQEHLEPPSSFGFLTADVHPFVANSSTMTESANMALGENMMGMYNVGT